MTYPVTTEAARLLRDHFSITEHTDPRQRVTDDLTAPQFVGALRDIERDARDDLLAELRAKTKELHAFVADYLLGEMTHEPSGVQIKGLVVLRIGDEHVRFVYGGSDEAKLVAYVREALDLLEVSS